MQELLDLLKVGGVETVRRELVRRLGIEVAPTYIRVATIAPLSNHGFAGFEAALLRVDQEGLLIGVEGRLDVPRSFVPWSNVAYFADGSELARQQAAIAANRNEVVIQPRK